MLRSFVKMHGLGNDVVILDLRDGAPEPSVAQYLRLADRRTGVGCDQVLLLDPPQALDAAARYRVVNADGTPAEHCGNGIRCVARYLERRGEARDRVIVEVGEESFELRLGANTDVRVDMGIPRFTPAAVPVNAENEAARYAVETTLGAFECGAVSMGNPHTVLEVADVDRTDVSAIGPAIQAAGFFPQGVNVGFMQVLSREAVLLRVFERGAGETRACGTGACAAMAIGRNWGLLDATVEVTLPGGQLSIEWQGAGERLYMTGPATFVFEGVIDL